MARGEAASASARSGSIKGLAQSVAKPAYRRMLLAEPALRRAVPVLIIAFLVTVGIGALVQVLDHRRQVLADAALELSGLSDIVAERLERAGATLDIKDAQAVLEKAVERTASAGRQIYLSDQAGLIVAAWPRERFSRPTTIAEAIGSAVMLGRMRAAGGALDVTLPDGKPAFASVRPLSPPLGQLVALHTRYDALAGWRSDTALTITLSATTGFVLLILGFAFHWQSLRAREADVIFDTVRERIDTALNSGRCGLWDWDLARGRVFWSSSMFALLGLEPRGELLTGGDIATLAHPEDPPLGEVVRRFGENGAGALDHIFRMRHAGGRWVWLRARCELVRQAGESGGHVIGIAVDITEQRELADKAAADEVRLRDAIEAISEAFVIWDADNRLVLCNSKFQRLHNLPDTAVHSTVPFRQLVSADAQAVTRTQPVPTEPPAGGGQTFEAQLEDGRWLQISERRTKDGGFVSVGTDISMLKRHEEKLVESERALLAMVSDLQASRRQLEQQAEQLASLAQSYNEEKTRAQEANHAKSEFLANMSHELRTPLNAIIGFSEMMESGIFGVLNERYVEYCRDIRDSGRYLLEVINEILDMSKIEAGRVELRLEDFKLLGVVEETVRIVTPRALGKELAITVEADAELSLRADRRSVKQIVLNLISNAVKFTPKGGRITVRGELFAGTVTISIEDTGIGIPETAMNKLGRPFEQVQSPMTKTYQGTGLGLAIAKSLTELHGGTMHIRSAQGWGTIVAIVLPADASAQASAPAQTAPDAAAAAGQAAGVTPLRPERG